MSGQTPVEEWEAPTYDGTSPSVSTPRNSISTQITASMGDADEYSVDRMGIADGFAPPHVRSASSSQSPSGRSRPRTPVNHERVPSRNSPSSKAEDPLNARDRPGSLTLRYDANRGPIPLRSSSATSESVASVSTLRPQRSASAASSSVGPRIQSQYLGGLGPTHPYAMYPQGTGLSRAQSIASTSTVRVPEQSHGGARGPQHPYTMYPQNTSTERGEDPPTLPALNIPVGFAGMGQSYQRRYGPDGEEAADIVGPDGHTEQLPPYTRYPDQPPTKPTNAAASSNDSEPTVQNTIVAGEGADSQGSLNSPQSRLSTRSTASESSRARLNVASTRQPPDENAVTEKSAHATARKRICGGKVPIWVCALIVLFFVICIALLGGVIGGMRALRKGAWGDDDSAAPSSTKPWVHSEILKSPRLIVDYRSPKTTVTETIFDAGPVHTKPANLQPPTPGQYSVALGDAQTYSKNCLAGPQLQLAWTCSLMGPQIQLDVLEQRGSTPLSIKLGAMTLDGAAMPLQYGQQAPVVTAPQRLSIRYDTDATDAGPAYVAQTAYTKVVILHEDEFDPRENSKRSLDHDDDDSLAVRTFSRETRTGPPQKVQVKKGDKPWLCYWNNTVLDVFIYTMHNSSSSDQGGSTNMDSSQFASSIDSANPSGAAEQRLRRKRAEAHLADTKEKRSSMPAPFPKEIKFEEHRMPDFVDDIKPYCTKMQMLNDMMLAPWPSNDPLVVYLDESFSSPAKRRRRHLANTQSLRRRDVAESCHCEWALS
ncbi:MAG: hypothetical protein M1833_004911 [Piccolia ochrophora]|nr:MAG: hypothetical protein M1833_004911 [Piccolia ochrophora]